MAEAIKGLKKMRRKLDALARKGSKRVARAGAVGMAAPLRREIRRGVKATKVPKPKSGEASTLKRNVRQAISSSIKLKGGDYELKVGFGVGKQAKGRRVKAKARAVEGGGVGISARNVHWAILGTGEFSKKTRSKRRKKSSGASTGSTEAVFEGVVQVAVAAGSKPALREAAKRAKIALQKEARKRR